MKVVIVPVLMVAVLSVANGQAQSPDTISGRAPVPRADLASPVQELSRGGDVPAWTGERLPPGHWAVEAVERASALLLLPVWLPGQRAVPLELVEAGLRQAVLTAEADDSPLLPLAEGWYARLLDEFPGLVDIDAQVGLRLIERRAGIAFVAREGAAAPGLGEFEPHRTGAMHLPDRRVPLVAGEFAAALSRHLSLAAGFEADPDEAHLARLELAAGSGRWRASVGRGEVGYGHGIGGGVALTGDVPIDALQLGTRHALELPGVFRPLGGTAFHTFLGRPDDERHPDAPYFWGASLRIQPNRRLTLAVNRAAMFGGDEAITSGRIASMLIGRVKGVGFENQVVTVSGRLVLPTERVVPTVIHLEWGAEDAAGSWWSVPGIVGGVSVPAVPLLPGLALAAEYAHFGTSCCGNPSWYRHWSFHGAWASSDRTLGHPLGGNGSQLMISGTLNLPEGRLKGQVFRRDRGAENLFAPQRLGVSQGIESSVELAPFDGWQLRIETGHEAGVSWSESRFRIGIEHF